MDQQYWDSVLTDATYAIGQLRRWPGDYDAEASALDALERIEELAREMCHPDQIEVQP